MTLTWQNGWELSERLTFLHSATSWAEIMLCHALFFGSGDGPRRHQVGGWWCEDESVQWQMARLFLCCGLLPVGVPPSTVTRLGLLGIRHVNLIALPSYGFQYIAQLARHKKFWDCINPVFVNVCVVVSSVIMCVCWSVNIAVPGLSGTVPDISEKKHRKTFKTSTAKDYNTHIWPFCRITWKRVEIGILPILRLQHRCMWLDNAPSHTAALSSSCIPKCSVQTRL